MAALEAGREEWVQQLGPAAYDEVLGSWRGKLARVQAGEQQWGLFRAFRPADGRDFHGAEQPQDGAKAGLAALA